MNNNLLIQLGLFVFGIITGINAAKIIKEGGPVFEEGTTTPFKEKLSIASVFLIAPMIASTGIEGLAWSAGHEAGAIGYLTVNKISQITRKENRGK